MAKRDYYDVLGVNKSASPDELKSAYRKLAVKTYIRLLKLDTSKDFFLSEKTINSLVNNGSLRADDAIEFIKNMELQIGNCANLENIILDDIE